MLIEETSFKAHPNTKNRFCLDQQAHSFPAHMFCSPNGPPSRAPGPHLKKVVVECGRGWFGGFVSPSEVGPSTLKFTLGLLPHILR